ncbi:hypothetical protein KHP60_20440 [Microvirga sp. 3-52]|nr:hypothetical protein [Microvirga sp. 3-52]MBO1904772.1 hypothetical protein [Microvirga sp. 3-52]MBS7454685.1 hypothetical protein [Microvirga sp. 3-52]
MAIKDSHLESRTEAACDRVAWRPGIPWFPTLLGALAVLNVASVVMVLME